jgi:hypothetical protein
MKLFKPCTSDTSLEDAIVLLCVHVERLLVDGLVLLDLVDMGLALVSILIQRLVQ